ncbi:hypothetical protein B7P34_02195 [Streptosporangium nondiastaticum]|uniref:Uncharacterized protein n=1 Tax=Streptosporangium nondiastaticum TaxID=35764 RepID=A0A9X7JVB5_9ACTN|nr:hypothetical protein [Streptosporangium nondiastaticum]PSJ30391.1 hypothetical protein B7P34_02195 [Streptosporangium nondiastaticum]
MPSDDSHYDKILRVRVTAKDADTLRALLRAERPDVGGRPRTHADGSVGIDAYVSERKAAVLEQPGVTVTVVGDATAVGKARQAEVGEGDRFADPSAVPRGLGDKVED